MKIDDPIEITATAHEKRTDDPASDISRRDLALKLLGLGIGGAAAATVLSGCGPDGSLESTAQAAIEAGTQGYRVRWVDSAIGTAADSGSRSGDLSYTPSELDSTNPPTIAIAKGCLT